MAGTLYVCATPIGNLDDMTFRVIKCLQSVDVIAAEDTRNSIKLLNHFEIKTPMTAYHEFNKYDKARALVQDMLAGKNVAIITDAGTPCVSDPGEELVRQAVEAGITVTSLPPSRSPGSRPAASPSRPSCRRKRPTRRSVSASSRSCAPRPAR